MENQLLIKKAQKGDKEALVQLIMEKQLEYYKLAYTFMKDKDGSLDAMEDMIVIIYENIHKLKNPEAFYSWSKTILVNCCRKILREENRQIPMEVIDQEIYDNGFDKKEDEMLLEKHLSRLQEKHREILRLRYFLDMDYNTIATILEIPLGTVKSRISIGLKQLKESLGGENIEGYR